MKINKFNSVKIIVLVIFLLLSLISFTSKHMCKLACTPIELFLLFICLIVFPIPLLYSKSVKRLFILFFLFLFSGFLLNVLYLNFLHSPKFPYSWLDKSSKEWIGKIKEIKKQRKIKNVTNESSGHASGSNEPPPDR
jgi:hypothetical protein